VQTPVGARCRDCAKLTKLPIFQISIVDYGKAVGIGLALAVGFGILWAIADSYLPGFAFLIIVAAGYLIGELASRSIKRKRSKGLQVVSGVNVLVCFAIAFALGLWVTVYEIMATIVAVVLAVERFR